MAASKAIEEVKEQEVVQTTQRAKRVKATVVHELSMFCKSCGNYFTVYNDVLPDSVQCKCRSVNTVILRVDKETY